MTGKSYGVTDAPSVQLSALLVVTLILVLHVRMVLSFIKVNVNALKAHISLKTAKPKTVNYVQTTVKVATRMNVTNAKNHTYFTLVNVSKN